MNFKRHLDKLAYSLKDCYDLDKFSKTLYGVGLVLSFLPFVNGLGLVAIFYSSWRCFSKNKYRRYQELITFENRMKSLKASLIKSKSNIKQLQNYKIFKCPNCSQKLRVPRGHGRITITCKKCGVEFKGKS